MSDPKALNCPFCGATATVETWYGISEAWCSDAECVGYGSGGRIEKWNRRAPASAPSGEGPSVSPALAAIVEEIDGLEKKATRAPWISAPRTANCSTVKSTHCASDGINPPGPEMDAMLMWPVHPNEKGAEDAAVEVTFANGDLIVALRNNWPAIREAIKGVERV